jgi:hypothetical protein
MENIMSKYPNCHFDNSHSGAYLAFKYFFPLLKVPKFILYIEDHDLYTHLLPDSKAMSVCMFNDIDLDLNVWWETFMTLNNLFENNHDIPFISDYSLIYNQMIEKGKAYLKVQEKSIMKVAKSPSKMLCCDIPVAVVNTGDNVSETGAKILELHSDVRIAIMWFFNHYDREYHFSIRSRKDQEDCTKLAQKYGGNGHAASSGFKVKK